MTETKSFKEAMWESYWQGYVQAYGVEEMDKLDRRAARSKFERWYGRNYND